MNSISRVVTLLAGIGALVAAGACGDDKSKPPSKPPERTKDSAKPAVGFVDVARQAGIAFKMQFLPGEQGERFKANLYDHGCGVAVADVDGDGLDDVYFLNELGRNALYRNDGDGRFTDVTEQSGVGFGDRVCVAAAFGDVYGDGRQDLYVTSARGGNAFLRNDGHGRFTDVTKEAGLTLVAHSESAAFFDYDGDGALDLFVTNTAKWTTDTRDPENRYYEGVDGIARLAMCPPEHNVLYRNDGHGHFTDVTEQAGLGGASWGGDVATLDYDGDGRLDLLVGNMFGASRLYHNEGGGKFKEVTKETLGKTSYGAIGVKAFDYDGDGRLDLMIVDMHSDMWMDPSTLPPKIEEHRKYPAFEGPIVEMGAPASIHQQYIDTLEIKMDRVVFGNTLFHNLGNGKFEEVSDKAGVETFWPWGIAAADYDMDGAVDVFIPSGMGFPFFYWRNYLLMNRGDGTFEDRSGSFGIDPPPGGKFLPEKIGGKPSPRSSRAAAVVDFDGDGRPDLVVNNFNDEATLFHNEFAKRNWTGFRLAGTRSNRDAVGALVTIHVGGRVQVRQVEPASGYLAQSTKTLLFGLADAAKIDSCEIHWPSGLVQTIADVKMNAVNAVVEPSGR